MNIGRLPQQQLVQLKPQIKQEEIDEDIEQKETSNTPKTSNETVQEAPVNAANTLGQESYCAQMGIRFISKSKTPANSNNVPKTEINTDSQVTIKTEKDKKLITIENLDDKPKVMNGKGAIIGKLGKLLWKNLKRFGRWMSEQTGIYAAQTTINKGVNTVTDDNESKKR